VKGPLTPTVFVTVGTDHHPFDRIVEWTDRWLAAHGSPAVTALIQTGTSALPARADHAAYLGYAEMEAAMSSATAVVTHGGPGSIMLCRYVGKKPIVVPRESSRGEHVDDHQVLFSRRLAKAGRIDLAEAEDTFAELLDRALSAPASALAGVDAGDVAATVERFELLVNEMLAAPQRRRLTIHRGA
jgi:UDP-N-acetylglucosamine transferase subunit ALG13